GRRGARIGRRQSGGQGAEYKPGANPSVWKPRVMLPGVVPKGLFVLLACARSRRLAAGGGAFGFLGRSAMPLAAPEVTLANVAAMIKDASASIEARDRRIHALENSVNDVLLKMGRPHGGGGDAFGSDAREQAIGLLELKHLSSVQKRDVLNPLPQFSS